MSSSSSSLRVGVVGGGAISRLAHVPATVASEHVELAAVVDIDRDRAAELAVPHGALAYESVAAMLAEGDVDAAIVAVPNAAHEAAVVELADAGVHVLCQKPLAHTLESAQRIVDACQRNGVALQVGFNQRFWEPIRLAKRAIDEGVVGTVHFARSVYSEAWNVYPAATGYRYDLEQSGGASIIDLSIHRIDLLRHLLGDISSICASITHSTLPIAVDDNVMMMCRFESGSQGFISSDRFSPQVSNATDLYGDAGTIHISTETINPFQSVPLAISSSRDVDELPEWLVQAHYPTAWWKGYTPGDWISLVPPRVNPYICEIDAFASAIADGRDPVITGNDGLRAQEAVTAAYRSMRLGSWVDVPLADQAEPIPTY